MTHKISKLACGAALASLLTTGSLLAGTKEVAPVPPPPEPEDCVTATIGLDIVSAYVSRGMTYEDDGFIAQPWAEVSVKVTDWLSLYGGIWNSINSEGTDAGAVDGGTVAEDWYEFDWYVGASLKFGNVGLSGIYGQFISPNNGFRTVDMLEFKLSYSDSDLWGGKFALNPYVKYFVELDGKAGSGADEGSYAELGFGPTMTVGPVTVSFPVAVGFGFDNFYAEDDGFGYASAGVGLSMPLSFIPECYGAWTAGISGTYYHGNTLDDFGRGEEDFVVGKFSLAWSF